MDRIDLTEIIKRIPKGYLVFLDIDGTLVPDFSDEITPETLDTLKHFHASNRVYLCTNSPDIKRNQKMEQVTGIKWHHSGHSKPSLMVTKALAHEDQTLPKVVIGDRWMTDGLFALRTKSDFYLIKRITDPKDRWYMKLVYFVDDFIGWFVKPFVTLNKDYS